MLVRKIKIGNRVIYQRKLFDGYKLFIYIIIFLIMFLLIL